MFWPIDRSDIRERTRVVTFALSDEKLPDIVGLEPFPVPAGASRRRVTGVNIWLEVWPANDPVSGPALHAALARTGCRLIDVAATGIDEPDNRRLRA